MSAQPFALPRPRFRTAAPSPIEQFALDVRDGLTRSPKQLSPKYFYDDVGSALFDVITLLPEYGLTRADERLLRANAESIALRLAPGVTVVELGSGSGRKTRPILQALCALQRVVDYYAIDGSASALERCRKELSGVPGARIHTLGCFYEEGIERVVQQRLEDRRRHDQGFEHERLLVLFLGSSIGNFDRSDAADFLARIRGYLRSGDALLLGADLEKPVQQLLAAYDDPTGVTAAFNLNLLARINRELGADFVLSHFCHEARWCPRERRIEMHLCSIDAQEVTIPASGITVPFEPGESIWSESSYKFSSNELNRLAKSSGFLPDAQWIDREWPFAENLWIVP
jgi:dimethylhistidine N-methyltransferase